MTDSPGNPREHWLAAEHAASRPVRGAVPKLSTYAEFSTRVKVRSAPWAFPLMSLGLALFLLLYSIMPSSGLLDLSPETRRIVLQVLAACFALGALVVFVWDRQTRAKAIREEYDAFVEHGCVVEAYRTSLNTVTNGESFQPAWVLIDTRIEAAQADRLYAAYDRWLKRLAEDRNLAQAVAHGMVAVPGPVRSETVFADEAVGGYMTGARPPMHWAVLTPKRGRGRWSVRKVRDVDEHNPVVPIG